MALYPFLRSVSKSITIKYIRLNPTQESKESLDHTQECHKPDFAPLNSELNAAELPRHTQAHSEASKPC